MKYHVIVLINIIVSYYLVKAFYDSNMTFDQITSHFDTVVHDGSNLLTG